MVAQKRFLNALLIAQFCAVGLIFYNHISISFLKGWSHFVSRQIYSEPGVAGLAFIVVSSGYLTRLTFASMVPSASGAVRAASVFITRRFWRLAIPIYFAVMADLAIFSFRDFGADAQTPFALQFAATLTQTWYYFPLDSRSLALPFGGSNMAWLGANLFFLTILYAISHRFWPSLRMKSAVTWLLCLSVFVAIYFVFLDILSPQITKWAADRYGIKLAGAYTLWEWLFEFSPYGHVAIFFSGVVLAQIHLKVREGGATIPAAICTFIIGVFLSVFFVQYPPKYTGVSIILISGLFFAYHFSGQRDVEECVKEGCGQDNFLIRVSRSSYEFFVLHLIFSLLFVLNFSPAMDVFTVAMLVGRLIVSTVFVYLICYGLSELVLNPIRAHVLKLLGLPSVEDRFV